MARIRTIKPSFWEDELLGAMPATTRLVFIGLFSLADDEGRMRSAPAFIRSQVFAYDEDTTSADVERALLQLHHARRIRLYGGAQRYLEVLNFTKHQYIQKPQPSQLPQPSRFNPTLPIEGDDEQEFHDALPDHSDTATGRKRKGMEEEGSIELKLSPADAVTKKPKQKPSSKAVDDPAVVACFNWYVDLWEKHGALAIDLSTTRANAIHRALKEHGKAKVVACVRGHHSNPWRHENGLKANDITVLLRPSNFDVGVEEWAKVRGVATSAAPATAGDDLAGMGY